MRRRTMLWLPLAAVVGGAAVGCSDPTPIGREPIPVSYVYPQTGDTSGRRWVAEGAGGANSSDPQLTIEQGADAVLLSMTAWNSGTAGQPVREIAILLPVEFTLTEPLGARQFQNPEGQRIEHMDKPPGR